MGAHNGFRRVQCDECVGFLRVRGRGRCVHGCQVQPGAAFHSKRGDDRTTKRCVAATVKWVAHRRSLIESDDCRSICCTSSGHARVQDRRSRQTARVDRNRHRARIRQAPVATAPACSLCSVQFVLSRPPRAGHGWWEQSAAPHPRVRGSGGRRTGRRTGLGSSTWQRTDEHGCTPVASRKGNCTVLRVCGAGPARAGVGINRNQWRAPGRSHPGG